MCLNSNWTTALYKAFTCLLTYNNFVHVNGKSLYIVYWRMMVVEGECPTPCKRERNCPGEGKISGGMCQGGNVRGSRRQYVRSSLG